MDVSRWNTTGLDKTVTVSTSPALSLKRYHGYMYVRVNTVDNNLRAAEAQHGSAEPLRRDGVRHSEETEPKHCESLLELS